MQIYIILIIIIKVFFVSLPRRGKYRWGKRLKDLYPVYASRNKLNDGTVAVIFGWGCGIENYPVEDIMEAMLVTMRDHAGFRRACFKMLLGLAGFLVLCSVGILYPARVYANPPKEVTLAHNGETQKLEVTIVHESSFPRVHYVSKVEIRRNGMPGGLFFYQSQPDKPKFSYSYDLSGQKGDIIDVTVSCRFYGSKTVSMTIGM